MKTYNLIIKSKNQKSLFKFIKFLDQNLENNFNYLKKSIQKKTVTKVITLLKSPHVNKTAQEQFEIRLFSKQLRVDTLQTFKFLIFLKRIKTHLFSDVSIKIKFFNTLSKNKTLTKKIFNPDNLHIKKTFTTYKNFSLKNLVLARNTRSLTASIKNKNLLKMFDSYGKF